MIEDEIAEVLARHIQPDTNCTCGWRPDHSDQRFMYWFAQHREHVAEEIVKTIRMHIL